MINLYIKQSPDGLMYLGKTVQDPYMYRGSGTIWRRHLKKHNLKQSDIDTMVIYADEDKVRFSYYAKKISEKLRVVESTSFANLANEEGQGGNTYHCISEEGKRNFHAAAFRPKSESHRKAIGLASTGRPGFNHKAVCQYDMEWNLIAVHKSLADACRSLGKKGNSGSEIKCFIDGGRWHARKNGKPGKSFIKYSHAFGYKWAYYVTK